MNESAEIPAAIQSAALRVARRSTPGDASAACSLSAGGNSPYQTQTSAAQSSSAIPA